MAHGIKRFETADHDLVGFWGEPSASIDWCERNYVENNYIAEVWNTLTCLAMAFAGLLACIIAGDLALREKRWKAHGMAWCVVGIGSMGFHGTLQYSGQLSDEVPMMWAIFVWCFCLLRIYDERAFYVRWCFLLYSCAFSILHAYFSFVTLFQVQYATIVVIGVGLTDRLVKRVTKGYGILSCFFCKTEPSSPGHKLLLRMVRQHIAWLMFAFICWLADQFACECLYALPFGFPNPQLHAWWHVFLGWSIHLGYQYSMALRIAEERGGTEKICWTWVLGFIPIAKDPGAKRAD